LPCCSRHRSLSRPPAARAKSSSVALPDWTAAVRRCRRSCKTVSGGLDQPHQTGENSGMPVRLSTGSVFSLRFFACLILLSFGFWAFSVHQHLGSVQRTIAWLSSVIDRSAGGHAIAQGDDIVIGTLTVNVNHECTGIFVYMLFGSFVLAYPTSWRARLIGLGIGTPAIFAVNVLRLATLAGVVEIYPQLFFYFHEYVWQGILTVFVLAGSIAWAERFG
jgi:exosortase/archaeosortase family protein